MANLPSGLVPEIKNFNYSSGFVTVEKLIESVAIGGTIETTNMKNLASGLLSGQPRCVVPGLMVVTYTATSCGSTQYERLYAALNDWYNKITGSALQSSDISEGDLHGLMLLPREYRAFIKSIDRALTIYNQTSDENYIYGKTLVDSLYYEGAYTDIHAHYTDIVKVRNDIADIVNKRLPYLKGTKMSMFDDLALDNIYVDDPHSKSALIAFRRNGFYLLPEVDQESARLRIRKREFSFKIFDDVEGVPTGENRYRVDRVTGRKYEISFIQEIFNWLDNITNDIWYRDVKPYLDHIRSKGGFETDPDIAPYQDKVINGSWKPVYSSYVISMLRNASIAGPSVADCARWSDESEAPDINLDEWNKGDFEFTQGVSDDYFENVNGQLIQGKYKFGSDSGVGLLTWGQMAGKPNKSGTEFNGMSKLLGYCDDHGRLVSLMTRPADISELEHILAPSFRCSAMSMSSGSYTLRFLRINTCNFAIINFIESFTYLQREQDVVKRRSIMTGNFVNTDPSVSYDKILFDKVNTAELPRSSGVMNSDEVDANWKIFAACPYTVAVKVSNTYASFSTPPEIRYEDLDNFISIPKTYMDIYWRKGAYSNIYVATSVKAVSSK